jgi:hypothetical protein
VKFDSPHHAFAYAYEILDVWRAGKGFDPDPDRLGGGGTGVMSRVLSALSIEMIADRHDPGIVRQRGRIDRRRSWFVLWFIDQDERKNWSSEQDQMMQRAIRGFAEELRERGIEVG